MGLEFSAKTREENLSKIRSEAFDVLVIGGGIVGAGVAREAALRGLSVALVDKGDFASGTSGRSSKLIHGGLRYLQQGRVRLVMEALRERELLSRMAEGLIRPLRFIVPVYSGSRPSPGLLRAGLMIYNLLGGKGPKADRVRAPELSAAAPPIKTQGLEVALSYLDCLTDDAWLTVRNVVDAHRRGAVIANYVEVVGFDGEGGQLTGVKARDVLGGEGLTVLARVVVNATGPWLDSIRRLWREGSKGLLNPSKGVHIIIPRERLPIQDAVVLFSRVDGRPVFLIPYGDTVIIGTTDTKYEGDPDSVEADASDIAYLLASVNPYFKEGFALSEGDILASYASLRPLVAFGAKRTVDESRRHKVIVDGNLVSVGGGKLTTYRLIAKDVTRVVEGILRKRFNKRARAGLSGKSASFYEKAGAEDEGRLKAFLRDEALVERLKARYGWDIKLIADILGERPELSEPLAATPPTLAAEVLYCTRFTMAMTLEDFMLRRGGLFFKDLKQGRACAGRVAELMGSELGWSGVEVERQTRLYLARLKRLKN